MSTAGPQLVAGMTPFPREFRNCEDLQCWKGDTTSPGAVPLLPFTYDFVVKPAMEKVVTCLVRTNLLIYVLPWKNGQLLWFSEEKQNSFETIPKKKKKVSLRSWLNEWLIWVWGKAQAGRTGVFPLAAQGLEAWPDLTCMRPATSPILPSPSTVVSTWQTNYLELTHNDNSDVVQLFLWMVFWSRVAGGDSVPLGGQ